MTTQGLLKSQGSGKKKTFFLVPALLIGNLNDHYLLSARRFFAARPDQALAFLTRL